MVDGHAVEHASKWAFREVTGLRAVAVDQMCQCRNVADGGLLHYDSLRKRQVAEWVSEIRVNNVVGQRVIMRQPNGRRLRMRMGRERRQGVGRLGRPMDAMAEAADYYCFDRHHQHQRLRHRL